MIVRITNYERCLILRIFFYKITVLNIADQIGTINVLPTDNVMFCFSNIIDYGRSQTLSIRHL